MTIEEAAKIPAEMYHGAEPNEKVAMIHLFGIRYAKEIAHIPATEIAIRAGINKSYGTEVNKGRNLARFVQPT